MKFLSTLTFLISNLDPCSTNTETFYGIKVFNEGTSKSFTEQVNVSNIFSKVVFSAGHSSYWLIVVPC